MRRIRAKQIDAVTRLVPVTMTVNLANVAIILFVFWNTGFNIFLGAWALAIAAAAVMATRSWARSRRRPPNEASRNATQADDGSGIRPGADLGRDAGGAASRDRADASIDRRLPDGGNDLGRRLRARDACPSAGLAYTWTMTCASALALLLCRVRRLSSVTAIFLLIYAVFISRNVVSNGKLFFDNHAGAVAARASDRDDLAAAEGISGKRQRLALADRRRGPADSRPRAFRRSGADAARSCCAAPGSPTPWRCFVPRTGPRWPASSR